MSKLQEGGNMGKGRLLQIFSSAMDVTMSIPVDICIRNVTWWGARLKFGCIKDARGWGEVYIKLISISCVKARLLFLWDYFIVKNLLSFSNFFLSQSLSSEFSVFISLTVLEIFNQVNQRRLCLYELLLYEHRERAQRRTVLRNTDIFLCFVKV